MFETFDHTADVGIRARADSIDELLAEAAKGLFTLIVPDLASVRLVAEVSISIAGEQPDLLLFDWLCELLYLYETRHLLLADFHVGVNQQGLAATARGEPADLARHQLEHEVKAITYHGLLVQCDQGKWLAEVIVDI
jgi:SHS2 domain-containing protein